MDMSSIKKVNSNKYYLYLLFLSSPSLDFEKVDSESNHLYTLQMPIYYNCMDNILGLPTIKLKYTGNNEYLDFVESSLSNPSNDFQYY